MSHLNSNNNEDSKSDSTESKKNKGVILNTSNNSLAIKFDSLMDKIDQLIGSQKNYGTSINDAVKAMNKSAAAMNRVADALEKSIKNQEVFVQYIVRKLQEEEVKKNGKKVKLFLFY